MRHQFAFIGLTSSTIDGLVRAALREVGSPDVTDLERFARAAWTEEAREWQYAAVKVLQRHQRMLGEPQLELAHHLVTHRAWWDTVDTIAAHLVGGIVSRHPGAVTVMDRWVESTDMWVARTAILHQLRFKEATDAERLFRYCLARAGEADFFYRKAIGWALRQYARTDPDAVRRFCDAHEDVLSPLSLREARKHL